ncbi:MAG: hypothetical protein Q4C34_04050 [Bacteroidales bacterium]|nr:hypothetical protein [Bacteroidales bacterium]
MRKLLHRLTADPTPLNWVTVALCVAIMLGLVIIVCLVKLAFIDGL